MVLHPRKGDLPHRAVANNKILSSRRRKLGHLTPMPDDLPTFVRQPDRERHQAKKEPEHHHPIVHGAPGQAEPRSCLDKKPWDRDLGLAVVHFVGYQASVNPSGREL